MVKDKAILNLANTLTIFRIILAPVFMYMMLNDLFISAFIIILIATLTDFLDGQVARIWHMQTRLGKLLDPLADKVIVFFALIVLVIKFEFPLWAALLIVSRDFILLIGGSIFLYKNKNKTLVPNLLGKITTFFQMSTIVIYILNISQIFKNFFLALTIISTSASMIIYFIKGYYLFFTKKKININLANRITLLRISLIPIFILFLMSDLRYKEIVAASLFIILALSDALDGYIARTRNQITDFGKLIDPLADKLLITSALVFMIGQGVQAWMAFTIIAREFVITGLRMVALTKHKTIAAKKSGKVKTVVQVIAISAVLLHAPFSYALMLLAVLITIYSGIEYVYTERHLIRQLA